MKEDCDYTPIMYLYLLLQLLDDIFPIKNL